MVRNADALVDAGYDVRVVGVNFMPRMIEVDKSLIAIKRWRYDAVDFFYSHLSRLRWHYSRLRRRFCNYLADVLPFQFIDSRAYGYAIPELTRLVMSEYADLFIAQQQVTLPVAANAALYWKSKYAFDAEDLLADCPESPAKLVLRYEKRYISNCQFVLTMSDVAAERLQEVHHLKKRPITLHNTPKLNERNEILQPNRRYTPETPSIYWFGQTLGPHSCADQIIQALPHLKRPLQFVLRGNPIPTYVEHLKTLSQRLGVSHLVTIANVAPPDQMVSLAAEHNILFGSQPGHDLFHQLAIGNKVFTGMMAGLALVLTDTIAHRRLIQDIHNCAFLVPNDNLDVIVQELDRLVTRPELLRGYQQAAWDLATQKYNWDRESQKLIHAVETALQTSTTTHII
jgi:glycosyltransferase involved in cell wall biosynthesis